MLQNIWKRKIWCQTFENFLVHFWQTKVQNVQQIKSFLIQLHMSGTFGFSNMPQTILPILSQLTATKMHFWTCTICLWETQLKDVASSWARFLENVWNPCTVDRKILNFWLAQLFCWNTSALKAFTLFKDAHLIVFNSVMLHSCFSRNAVTNSVTWTLAKTCKGVQMHHILSGKREKDVSNVRCCSNNSKWTLKKQHWVWK